MNIDDAQKAVPTARAYADLVAPWLLISLGVGCYFLKIGPDAVAGSMVGAGLGILKGHS